MYIKLKLKSENCNAKSNEFLFGLPSAFVAHSFVHNILRTLDIKNKKRGVAISYLRQDSYRNNSSYFLKRSADRRKKLDGETILETPTQSIEVILIFNIDVVVNSNEDLLILGKNIRSVAMKNRFAGGFIRDVEIDIKENIEDFGRVLGFFEHTSNEVYDNAVDMIFKTSYISGGIKAPSIIGYYDLSERDKEHSFFNRNGVDHVFGEAIIGTHKFESIKEKLTDEMFDNIAFKTEYKNKKLKIKNRGI